MHLEKQFDVNQPRDKAAEIAGRDETLVGLFPDTKTEIVSHEGNRRTTRSEYTALGRSGTVRFHFDTLPDGNVAFEKVCDGNVWRKLTGSLRFEPRGQGTRVRVSMDGRTKPLIPEFTIKGAMQDQIDEMVRALRARIEEG